MASDPKIFSDEYAASTTTESAVPEKSKTKEFLKEPITQSDVDKYGTNKPHRIEIRATIRND